MLIALASAKGSPGVTTLASALGAVWPRDVVVADCDPAGGDFAFRNQQADGSPLEPERGLLSLAAAARRGISPDEVTEHVQTAGGGLDVLVGVSRPEQLTGIGPVWPQVAHALRDLSGMDVIADCGRVTAGSPATPILAAADAVVVVVRPGVAEYGHLRERLRWQLAKELRLGDVGSVPVGIVTVTTASDTSATRDLDRLLQYDGASVSVIGRMAHDTKAAETLAGRRTANIKRSLLLRSARQLTTAISSLAISRPAEAREIGG